MKFRTTLVVAALAMRLAIPAHAQSEASSLSAVSAMPVASVIATGAFAASAVLTIPLELSAGGMVLVVKSVELSARGTVYMLERASDGAQASVEVIGRGASAASMAAGTLVAVSVIGAGTILSVAGTAIAFIPNAIGRALLYNERVTS